MDDNKIEKKAADCLEQLLERYPVLESQREAILKGYLLLEACYRSGGKLLVAGNGGSASDSEHIVGELMKGFKKARRVGEDVKEILTGIDGERGKLLGEKLQGGLPAIALTGHPALSSAYANDESPECVYAQQIYGYGKKGDVFLGISTSGNAENVMYAAVVARAKGLAVIGLTGEAGGELGKFADVAVKAPARETYQIQELHLPIYHCWCMMLEERFFG